MMRKDIVDFVHGSLGSYQSLYYYYLANLILCAFVSLSTIAFFDFALDVCIIYYCDTCFILMTDLLTG